MRYRKTARIYGNMHNQAIAIAKLHKEFTWKAFCPPLTPRQAGDKLRYMALAGEFEKVAPARIIVIPAVYRLKP